MLFQTFCPVPNVPDANRSERQGDRGLELEKNYAVARHPVSAVVSLAGLCRFTLSSARGGSLFMQRAGV